MIESCDQLRLFFMRQMAKAAQDLDRACGTDFADLPRHIGGIARSLSAATSNNSLVSRGRSCSSGCKSQFAIIRSAAAT